MSFNMPSPNPSRGVDEMAADAATEADRPEQEREYEQLQAEQTPVRPNQERLSLRERWRYKLHRWADTR